MDEIGRTSEYPIHPLILNRWSPRAMSGEPLRDDELLPLFEAARWAPSAYNNQPWRFIYAKKDTSHWSTFFELLIDFNQSWCKNAAVLGVVISRTLFHKNNKPSATHAYDTGAAWENLALEGNHRGFVVHGMQGFDYDLARKSLAIPDEFAVLAMFAIGKKAPKESLPKELQEKETPSTRKPISAFAFEGLFDSEKSKSNSS